MKFLKQRMAKEEVEQIDELSTDTLSSYASKALQRKLPTQQYDRSKGMVHKDGSGKEISSQEAGRQIAKHVTGMKRAGDKILKNANKNIKTDSKPQNYGASIQKDYDKYKGRYQSDSFQPTGNMVAEISNELLARYKKKAGEQASYADTMAYKTSDQQRARKLLDAAHKRFKGINRATSKQFDNDMKKEEVSLSENAKPNELHISDAGGGKYKVHAVGSKFAHGMKVGEHITDSHLDDFSEMGGKVKMVKPPKKD